MRFAIAIPQQTDDGAFDPAGLRAFLARAEALGFDSAWTQEQVIGRVPHLSPLEVMTFAAAATERLRLGCAVFVSPLHSPVHLAKSIASLDQISRGRIEVGLGSGGRTRMFSAFGITADALVTRFVEGFNVMKACWTADTIDVDGRFWQLKDAAMEPKPFQKPHPPVWFGGNHPDAVRRAARLADGFFGAGSSTTAQFLDGVEVLRAEVDRLGRDPATFPLAKRVYVYVDEDPERARTHVSAYLDRLYGFFGLKGMEVVAVYGTPDDCRLGLQEVAAAGTDLLLLNATTDDLPLATEQMERLAAEVVPQLA